MTVQQGTLSVDTMLILDNYAKQQIMFNANVFIITFYDFVLQEKSISRLWQINKVVGRKAPINAVHLP